MQTGVFVFGAVEMDDAGAGDPAPTDRRFSQKQMWDATLKLLDLGVCAEQTGFDTYWWTEHHFQYEGYEVVPNGVLLAAILAERTHRLRIGAMFNVITQWHPLRLAEDFATMHNLSGGRGILGIGRGTVPREGENLGTVIGSSDNPDAREHDRVNREQFEEIVEILQLAMDNETFSYSGRHYRFPQRPIPDRGGFAHELTLVPRPLYPYEIWQPVSSPNTMAYVPAKGFGAVYWQLHHDVLKRWWEDYAVRYAEAHPDRPDLRPGENRMVVLNVKIADTHEEAWRQARRGHDEFWKFLGPYGWSKGYLMDDGTPAPAGLRPSLEQSVAQKVWLVGTAEEVAEGIAWYQRELGLEHLTLFPHFPGDTYAQCEEQLHRFHEEVRPLL